MISPPQLVMMKLGFPYSILKEKRIAMKKLLISTIVLLMALSFALSGCAPAAAAEEPTNAPPAATQQQAAPVENTTTPTVAQPSAVPTAAGPQVGGKLVIVYPEDETTFDIQKLAGWNTMFSLLNSTLIAVDPQTNQFAPWLAESWTVSPDGLSYTFNLRHDVKFHNGDPLTARDWVYTIQRALDPATASPLSSSYWAPAVTYEAVDDYTLKLTLAQPSYTFLYGLSLASTAPISQRAVEEEGDTYDMNPVGTGPYIFKSYSIGDKIVLERNPDYTWGPSWVHAGPAYIQTIEFRIIPEYSTQVAGLEAGEIDMFDEISAGLGYSDISRIQDDGRFQIIQTSVEGMYPFVQFNVSKPPFDDLRVRQAFSLAVNRDALVTVALQGNGKPSYTPLNEGTIGYNPDLQDQGLHYDLERAKELMQEAGYTYNENGMLVTPNGQPFVFDMPTIDYSFFLSTSQVLVDQYKTLGVTLNISLEEIGIWWSQLSTGDFAITITGDTLTDADVIYLGLHSTSIGGANTSFVRDPVLDEILDRTRSETNSAARQAAVDEAQLYIMNQAYIVPLFSPYVYIPINKRVQGIVFANGAQTFWFEDAYIVNQ
jgi:peptide/nickel transport system substrate-binding protein